MVSVDAGRLLLAASASCAQEPQNEEPEAGTRRRIRRHGTATASFAVAHTVTIVTRIGETTVCVRCRSSVWNG